jgi:hypothetical protein
VETTEPPRFRVGPLGQGSLDLAWGAASREIAAVPVRSDPADAEVLATFAEGREEPLPAYRLNRWGHTLALTPGFDELVSLPFLRDVIPYEHQIAAVQTVLNRMRGRALLADEVGLGKTVEAAIILAELWRRRLVRRVLILTPPGLVTQWQEELRRKACLDFVPVRPASRTSSSSATAHTVVAVSRLARAAFASGPSRMASTSGTNGPDVLLRMNSLTAFFSVSRIAMGSPSSCDEGH